MNWSDLTGEIARFARVPVESIDREALLIEDLGFDSLALTELLVTLVEEYDLEVPAAELLERNWEQTPVAELFELYCKDGAQAPDRLAKTRNGLAAS